jgi:hypothetical protein
MYPIIFSLIVNLPTIMAYVVASVFFFGVITFVTVCTEVDAIQERSHAGNHFVVVVMKWGTQRAPPITNVRTADKP